MCSLSRRLSYGIPSRAITALVFRSLLFFLIIVPQKCESSDTGSSDMPRRSQKVSPSWEKVKVLDPISKDKKNFVLRMLRSTI